MTAFDSENIIGFLDRKESKIKCISFDVFDTLLYRSISPPEQVLIPSAKKVVEIFKHHGISESVSGCLNVRQMVTKRLQNASLKSGNDSECHINEVIFAWLQNYLPPEIANENWEFVLSEELEAEKAVCFASQGMKALVEKIKQNGKRIIYISDMYLSSQEIFSLLDTNGFGGLFDAGYVSADIGLSKKSGRLFQYVLKEENLAPAEILHIGDDYLADFLAPKKLGINAYHFHDSEYDAWSYRHRKLFRLAKNDLFWQGARWVNMIPPASNSNLISQRDFPYALGLRIIGPLFANFIHQTILRVLEERSQLVLFPSREGFILKEIYDRLIPKITTNSAPPGHYVFLSRKATFLPSISKIGDRETARGLSTISTLRGLLEKFKLIPEQFKALSAKCGFPDIEKPIELPRDSEKLQLFLQHTDFVKQFVFERDTQRKRLHDYLSQFGFWEVERVAIVDVGWDGTIQESLSLAFQDKEVVPDINGYYIALLGRTPHPCAETVKSKFHGIFHDYRSGGDRTGIGRFTELFETAARAPHGTTLSYKQDLEGHIIPVLETCENPTRTAELGDSHLVTSIQAGILDYVDLYAQWITFQDKPPETNTQFVLSQIDRFTRFPTRAEASQLGSLTPDDDFEGTRSSQERSILSLSVENNENANPCKEPLIWPEGFYAAMKLPAMQYLFNFYRALFKEPF